MKLRVICFLLLWLASGEGFNLSPTPSYTFKQPPLNTFINQTRSSYFGYSINLRNSGVFVGAPRAQSDLESQRKVNETGAVYRCSFTPNTSQCTPVYLDKLGNVHYENDSANPDIQSEKKDYQMLGASVDGLGSDDDWLVACAPKLIGDRVTSYWLHGICYLTESTRTSVDPKMVYKIKPLRNQAKQYDRSNYIYIFGEQGLSVHVTDDGKEVLIGAPGVLNWRGTVIRYRQLPILVNKTFEWKNVIREPNQANTSTHETVVPNPHLHLDANSYLGYSVSSGYFLGTQKLLYVAGAPQSQGQSGEVIIFDYVNNNTTQETNLVRYKTLEGQQFGEYFGYSLLTEDFNSDGLPDLAVGAPMHSHLMEHENGAVYVFLNGGDLRFELQVKLSSSYELGGRFGTSLGKIGDCNGDGYADIAIGAPFEGNGVVYIFLGSANGLQAKPSQRLEPPTHSLPLQPSRQAMFGFAISRGVDIDNNGYNDIAIGAPEGEAVYVYRTYPVVRIEARINSTKRELPAEGGTFEISCCWSAEFPAGIPFNVTLQYKVDIDKLMRRASVRNVQSSGNVTDQVVLVGTRTECKQFLVNVTASHTTLHQPIIIDMEYMMSEQATPPKDGPFCEHCAILDPNEFTRVQEWIPFRTGCMTDTCMSDLRITSIRWSDVPSPYLIGSTKVATIEVEIENSGENAFLPQVNLSVPSSLQAMAKSVPECVVSPAVDGQIAVLCDLNNRLPLRSGAKVKRSLQFDMTHLEGNRRELKVRAVSLTSSKEQWAKDNEMEYILPIRESSLMEILSKINPQSVSLDQQKGTVNMTQRVDVLNNGPSTMRDPLLYVDVPLTYIFGTKRCQIIDPEDVRATGSYNDTPLKIDWIQPNEDTTLPKFSFHIQNNPDVTEGVSAVETNDNQQPILNDDWMDVARAKRSNLWVQPIRQELSSIQPHDLPANRTVFFNCAQNSSAVECLQLQTRLDAIPSGPKPLRLELHYKLDLDAIAACLQEQEDIFVVQILSDLEKPSDGAKDTFSVVRNNPHTLVTRSASRSTPTWIYTTSSLGGLFLLAIITYVMFRQGFFKRQLKEDMTRLHRESVSFKNSSAASDDLEQEDDAI
ncbi:AGAP006826-PA-like protein [Anopheles sinensis]|uniref:AGAP006826-PA-like protein n=1 Tax=Anopheles sinensis TaxID=74873 RepID=A0A084WMT0_ANOSI|nr:AGAP006826-PA-like protein [Anopheles sinensis]